MPSLRYSSSFITVGSWECVFRGHQALLQEACGGANGLQPVLIERGMQGSLHPQQLALPSSTRAVSLTPDFSSRQHAVSELPKVTELQGEQNEAITPASNVPAASAC